MCFKSVENLLVSGAQHQDKKREIKNFGKGILGEIKGAYLVSVGDNVDRENSS